MSFHRLPTRSVVEENGAPPPPSGPRPNKREHHRWRRPRVSWEELEAEANEKSLVFRTGTVRAVKPFGFLVDIGAQRLGLVPVREVADYFVKDISAEAAPGDRVLVRVLRVDRERSRIELSMRDPSRPRERQRPAAAGQYVTALVSLSEWGIPAWSSIPRTTSNSEQAGEEDGS
jgi:predicted RNA-binding protein with RPS1 domain